MFMLIKKTEKNTKKVEWYRNETWNKEIEQSFEMRLKRSRTNSRKAQYLKIQAGHLLDSKKSRFKKKGVELLERLIDSYPEEEFDTMRAHELLGDFYLSKKSFQKAEKYFRIVTEYYYENTRSGTTGLADIKLCEVIVLTNQKDKFEEAYQIGTEKFDKSMLLMNNAKFYYTYIMANLCYVMEKRDEAYEFADMALELSEITEPQFKRHKTVGLVKATKKQLKKLKKIYNWA